MARSILAIDPSGPANLPAADGEFRAEQPAATPLLVQNWHLITRWKWVIAGILAAFLAAGLIITLLMQPIYSASSRVEISRVQKNFARVEGVDQTNASQDEEFYQTQYALLKARSLAERVARQLRLADNQAFFEAHGLDPDAADPASGPATPNSRRDAERRVVDVLLRNLNVNPIARSSLVDVVYSSGSPELSATVANSWVQQFVQATIDRRFASTADARTFLEQRLNELREKVENSERQAVNFAQVNDIVTIDRPPTSTGGGSRTLASSNLETLNQALLTAVTDRVTAQSRVRGNGALTSESLNNAAINALREKRASLSADYARLMVQFEPNYPPAQALKSQIDQLARQIGNEEARIQSTRGNEYQQALARETALRSAVDALKSKLTAQQRNSIQYNIYQREADTNRQLYDALLQRYKEIGVAGVDANNIAVVDMAQPPKRPSSPNLLINLLLSGLAGLLVVAVVVYALDQIDEGIRDPAQVPQLLQIPLIGSVPAVDTDPLTDLNDAKSNLSEAYLTVRSSLAFASNHGVPRSLMVTSTRSGEGKSVTSLALATVLGRTGKKVLLVDADMRSPSVHEYIGIRNDVGLSNYLAGDDDWQAMIHDTSIRNLSAMSAGPQPPSAAELLSGDRMAQLVREMLDRFDHVLIDSPPMLGLADAPLLACAVEGSVFVTQAGGVPVRGVKEAVDRLRRSQTHIFGAIVTKLTARHSTLSYGYGYGYGYGQTPEAAVASS